MDCYIEAKKKLDLLAADRDGFQFIKVAEKRREFVANAMIEVNLSLIWTTSQAETKFEQLKTKYKECVDAMRQTGGAGLGVYQKKYPWFDKMAQYQEGHPAIEPAFIIDDEGFTERPVSRDSVDLPSSEGDQSSNVPIHFNLSQSETADDLDEPCDDQTSSNVLGSPEESHNSIPATGSDQPSIVQTPSIFGKEPPVMSTNKSRKRKSRNDENKPTTNMGKDEFLMQMQRDRFDWDKRREERMDEREKRREELDRKEKAEREADRKAERAERDKRDAERDRRDAAREDRYMMMFMGMMQSRENMGYPQWRNTMASGSNAHPYVSTPGCSYVEDGRDGPVAPAATMGFSGPGSIEIGLSRNAQTGVTKVGMVVSPPKRVNGEENSVERFV